jgi:hypothetical protein
MGKLAALLIGLTLVLPGSVFAAKIVWNYNIHGPKRAWTRTVEVAKEMLEKASNGEFELKIHYSAALGPSKENLEAMKVGALESGLNCAIWAPSRVPLQTVLELPFILPRDGKQMAQVQDAVFRHPAVVKELAQRWKSVYFLNQNLPIYEAMGNKRLASVDDLKGVRIRAGGEQGLVLRDFGAVITMIHPAEVYLRDFRLRHRRSGPGARRLHFGRDHRRVEQAAQKTESVHAGGAPEGHGGAVQGIRQGGRQIHSDLQEESGAGEVSRLGTPEADRQGPALLEGLGGKARRGRPAGHGAAEIHQSSGGQVLQVGKKRG